MNGGSFMTTLERALPGRQNAKDWLTLKIVEVLASPMDDKAAEKLARYNDAYNAVCQWSGGDGLSELSGEDAKEWAQRMENSDGTHGAHWTLEQAKKVMEQNEFECAPVEFWMALCMMYSDYSKAAQKHGVGNSVEFYADMACAFLKDKDAPKDKLARYYRHIVNT